ncbi:hypothetical protein Leryth_005512 [Lithospermum erythrorhizon]|nr:hypothetical protein Leryth_005512 [Lithospermum erythrorhizon]
MNLLYGLAVFGKDRRLELVKARKTDIQKWKDQSHSKVSLEAVTTERSFRGMHGDNRRFRGGKKQHSIPNAHVPSEIKDMEQIRKERQKADRMSM